METVILFVLLFQVMTIVFCVGDERVKGFICPDPLHCTTEENVEQFDPRTQTKFRLFTKKNLHLGQVIKLNNYKSLDKSNFDASKRTKVIIHGYQGGSSSAINELITSAYLRYHDVNVIVASWGQGSRTLCYNFAVDRVRKVGVVVAEFLDFLLGSDAKSWNDLSLVGFSLGAHVSGFAGRNTKKGRVGTIVGLDPASPSFSGKDKSKRLDKSDAKYVECIHTNAMCYGMMDPFCSADFYPNCGFVQPGCSKMWINTCDHERAYELFAASLGEKKFMSHKCLNQKPIKKRGGENLKKCCGETVSMGGEPGNMRNEMSRGVFYLETGSKYPFELPARSCQRKDDVADDDMASYSKDFSLAIELLIKKETFPR